MIQTLTPVALALLLGLLLLPVAIRVQVWSGERTLTLRVDGGLLVGLCGISLSWCGPAWTLRALLFGWPLRWPALRTGPRPKTSPPRGPAESAAPKRRRRRSPLAVLRLIGQPALRLLTSVPSSVGVRRLRIFGQLGLSDPAKTGVLCAVLQAFRGVSCRAIRIELAPSFVRPGFRGTVELLLHLHLGKLLWFVLRAGIRISLCWVRTRRQQTLAKESSQAGESAIHAG